MVSTSFTVAKTHVLHPQGMPRSARDTAASPWKDLAVELPWRWEMSWARNIQKPGCEHNSCRKTKGKRGAGALQFQETQSGTRGLVITWLDTWWATPVNLPLASAATSILPRSKRKSFLSNAFVMFKLEVGKIWMHAQFKNMCENSNSTAKRNPSPQYWRPLYPSRTPSEYRIHVYVRNVM